MKKLILFLLCNMLIGSVYASSKNRQVVLNDSAMAMFAILPGPAKLELIVHTSFNLVLTFQELLDIANNPSQEHGNSNPLRNRLVEMLQDPCIKTLFARGLSSKSIQELERAYTMRLLRAKRKS